MGFLEQDVNMALSATGNDFERGLDYLCQMGKDREAEQKEAATIHEEETKQNPAPQPSLPLKTSNPEPSSPNQ